MPSVNCSPFGPKPQFELSTGIPAVGYKLFFYVAGSVNTKQDTYTDSTGSVANTNPVVLNSLGQPTTQIWFTSGLAYKVVLAPSTDTDPPTSPVWTIDNLRGINDTTVAQDQWVASGLTPTYIGATQFTVAGDQTAVFTIGRRIKATVTAGTVYGTITGSSFGVITTVTVVMDSGALDAGLSAISFGLLSAYRTSQTTDDAILSVKNFGAIGDGVSNDAGPIAAAISAAAARGNGAPVFLPAGTYLIGQKLTIPSNISIFSNGGAKVRVADNVNDHAFQINSGASKVKISGFEIDGNKANNAGGCGIACTGTGASYVTVQDMHIHDCDADGVRFVGSTSVNNVIVSGCVAENNGSAGITSDNTIQYFTWVNNIARNNGTHGIGLIGIGLDGTITGNEAHDNGQGTPTADNFTGYNSSNARIVVSSNVSRGGLNNGIHFGGNDISYIGNIATNATQYGIVHSSSGGAVSNAATITGNVSRSNSGAAGIWIENCNSGVVSGNICSSNSAGHGILITACSNLSISGNTCRSNGVDGIRNDTASSSMSIIGNTCSSNGGDGLQIDNVSSSTISGNTSISNTGYGINSASGDANNVIESNNFRSNTAGGINGTYAATTIFGDNKTDTSISLASAATMTFPPHSNTFYITGTTGITDMSLSWTGRKVKLIFDDVLTVTEGGNMELAGNFTTSFTDSLVVTCRGSKWNEDCRSNN